MPILSNLPVEVTTTSCSFGVEPIPGLLGDSVNIERLLRLLLGVRTRGVYLLVEVGLPIRKFDSGIV
jgi:hypothetical protein